MVFINYIQKVDGNLTNISNNNVFIVIPARNESTVIGAVVAGIKSAGFKNIIVVDDGSIDKTSEKAKLAGAVVLRHRINRGKGAAVKTGLIAAQRNKAEIVVSMDGDGQHDPLDIRAVIAPIIVKEADVVLGTRLFDLKNISFHKIIANKVANLLTRILTGLWVADSQSGFRAFDSKALGVMIHVGDKYEYDSEIIRQIARNGLKYKEVPIRVYYTEYSINKTHKQGLINGFWTLCRLVWNIIS